MEHIAALLLIVACSDDLAQCRELPAPVPIFETIEACDAELPISLGQIDAEGERILAKCIYVDPAMEEEDAELVWDVDARGTLVASVEFSGGLVAMEGQNTGQDYLTQE